MKFIKTFSIEDWSNIYTSECGTYELYRFRTYKNNGTSKCDGAWAVQKDHPPSWKMLLSGYFPNLVYDRGGLHKGLPFEELRTRSLINRKAKSADGASDFSRRIRKDLPGI